MKPLYTRHRLRRGEQPMPPERPLSENPLTAQRCYNHQRREAVARCPDCGRFFCRECVTEHEDRVLCTACLRKLTKKSRAGAFGFAILFRIGQCSFGLFLLWLAFYYLGRMLLALPADFHEGTLWQANWWEAL